MLQPCVSASPPPPRPASPAPCPPSSRLPRAKRASAFQIRGVLQPLGHTVLGAFEVHRFCGGFNLECGRLFNELHEQTVHFARLIDPQYWRRSKVVTS